MLKWSIPFVSLLLLHSVSAATAEDQKETASEACLIEAIALFQHGATRRNVAKMKFDGVWWEPKPQWSTTQKDALNDQMHTGLVLFDWGSKYIDVARQDQFGHRIDLWEIRRYSKWMSNLLELSRPRLSEIEDGNFSDEELITSLESVCGQT